MKQLKTIFCHEYMEYLKTKSFIVMTILFSLVLIIVMCIPSIIVLVKSFDAKDDDSVSGNADDKTIILLKADESLSENLALSLQNVFNESEIVITTDDIETIKNSVKSEDAERAFVFDSLLSYTCYVNTKEMQDYSANEVDAILEDMYLMQSFVEAGLSIENAQKTVYSAVQGSVVPLSIDQSENFLMAYVMIFALYIMVLTYGSMIATSVAMEKNSRAMELLITSARPSSLLFGKVFATCAAALTQMGAVIICGFITYSFTNQYWSAIPMISELFNITAETIIYFVMFFVMGFLVYAFLFASLASTASKLEDANSCLTPVMIVFIACFVLTIQNMFTGADSGFFKVLSYIPFSASMAMFTRIALTDVPAWAPLLSIGILALTILLIGWISAKIYRIGVLLYGTQPKIKDIFKALKEYKV